MGPASAQLPNGRRAAGHCGAEGWPAVAGVVWSRAAAGRGGAWGGRARQGGLIALGGRGGSNGLGPRLFVLGEAVKQHPNQWRGDKTGPVTVATLFLSTLYKDPLMSSLQHHLIVVRWLFIYDSRLVWSGVAWRRRGPQGRMYIRTYGAFTACLLSSQTNMQ